jgi:hypothetical protein
MAGLYDGLEEVAFKPVAGGYVFQTSNPWLIGPHHRYFVSETQKAEIVACIRQTMRRMTPFVLAVAVLIPLVLVVATLWLVIGDRSTATLTVATQIDHTSRSTVATLPIDPTGATFSYTVAPPAGSLAVTAIHVSGPPGGSSIAGFTVVDQTGKPTTYTQPFGPDGAQFNFNAANGSAVFTVVGRTGATPGTIYLFVGLLALGMFLPFIILVNAYRMRKLRPLIAGLPRSDERITLRENAVGLAAKIPLKLVLVQLGAGVLAFIGGATRLAEGILEDGPISKMDLIVMATTGLMSAYFAHLLVLRLRKQRANGSADRSASEIRLML